MNDFLGRLGEAFLSLLSLIPMGFTGFVEELSKGDFGTALFALFMAFIPIGGILFLGLLVWLGISEVMEKLGFDSWLRQRREKKMKGEELKRYKPILEALKPEIDSAIDLQMKLLDFSHGYLMKREWDATINANKGLTKRVQDVPEHVREASDYSELIETYLSIQGDRTRVDRNSDYKKRELEKSDQMLSDIDGKSLDAQQRDAVITDEYNNLIIAGAGSGKTLTVVGKVKYLTQRHGIKPQEILITSFTRKSVEELQQRLEKAGLEGVSCRTFHSLGLNQLPGVGVANDNELRNCTLAYLKGGIKNHPEQVSAYLEFYGCYKYVPKSYEEYESSGQRYQELKAADLVTIKGKLDTLNGERVKSIEELMIANYLFLNGVNYVYEMNYTGEYDKVGRAYQPDFYLVDYDIWLEHFGIDKNGHLPWMQNASKEQEYIDGMAWKREVHAQNGTKLIESYSYWNKDHDLLNKLEALLEENGVELEADPEQLSKLYDGLSVDDRYLNSIIKLVTTFLSLAKANNIDLEEIWERGRREYAGEGYMWHRFELFMTFAEPIMVEYAKRLRAADQIDFDDMINLATKSIRTNGIEDEYKYIIVDEYQDISKSRFDLLQAIREQQGSKLICVGDDWQAIYRFAGSDVSMFTNFDDYVGYSEHLKIERTYRNSQELVDITSEFIERNESQIPKNMTAAKHEDAPVNILQIDDGAHAMKIALSMILQSEDGRKGTIYVLGRHNMDIERLFPELEDDEDISFYHDNKTGDIRIRYKDFDDIRYLTVHKAKGLEADNVIVLNLISSLYGFPNRLEDDPILQILLESGEEFEFAEERRLFYVAMTRTRNKAYLVSCTSSGWLEPSSFINELKKSDKSAHITITTLKGAPNEWDPVLCPVCGTGRLIECTNLDSGDLFLGCSNYPYCDNTYSQTEILTDRIKCPTCGDWMLRRRRNDDGTPFFACSNKTNCGATIDADENFRPIYHERRNTQNYSKKQNKPRSKKCPKCGGSLVLRTNSNDDSKFYGCSSWPDCSYTIDA